MKTFAFILTIIMLAGLCSCKYDGPAQEGTGSVSVSEAAPAGTGGTEVTEPVEEAVFDCDSVVEAYRSGDTSALDEKELAVYQASLDAIGEFYTDGMTEEETVIAAHDWTVVHTSYDEMMLLPVPKTSEDADNPYGALINRQAICMGYTSTFQMFMDMLGVESIIVSGEALDEEHAWNMVRLDGNWYHVDLTWDDFVPDEEGRPPFHLYCLVPDSVMEIQHIWDRESSPFADSYDRIYYASHGLLAQSREDSQRILNDAYNNGSKFCEIMVTSSDALDFSHVQYYWENAFGNYTVMIYWLL